MSSLVPWHMWGAGQLINLNAAASQQSTGQLAQVSYKRPETWRFQFSVAIEGGFLTLLGNTLEVSFDLQLGLGRSTMVIPDFCRFVRPLAAGSHGVGIDLPFYTSAVLSSDFGTGAGPVELLCDHVVAENIQCVARVFTPLGTPLLGTDFLNVAVHAHFAPNVHERPEWFEQRFPGGETEGH